MAGTAIGPKHFRCTPWLMEVFRALTKSGAKALSAIELAAGSGISAVNDHARVA